MSLPTDAEFARLDRFGKNHKGKFGPDDESYHQEFDRLLEEKLDTLDPEWMAAMRTKYKADKVARWYA